MPSDASRLYSRNVYALLSPWIKDGRLNIDPNDDVAKGAVVARDGNVLIGGAIVTELAHLVALLTVFVLAIFVGFEVISKVPTTLHTPLMSATNAIHGIVLAGAIAHRRGSFSAWPTAPRWSRLAVAAVTLGAINVFGGFAVTERMLQMFRRRGDGK